MDKDKLQELKAQAEQRATQLFEAYHQAIGSARTYAAMIEEIEQDTQAQELVKDASGKKKG